MIFFVLFYEFGDKSDNIIINQAYDRISWGKEIIIKPEQFLYQFYNKV